MMKRIGGIAILCNIIVILLMTYFDFQTETVVIVSLILIISTFVILFETRNIDAKTMSILATLSALGGILRVPFAVIPGFNPVTFICAVSGYTLGPVNGFMIGSMSAFISNFFLGHGPWTLWQIMGWGLCGVFFGLFKKIIEKSGLKGFVLLCGLWGYIYGIILDQWFIINFIRPITFKAIIAGIVGSFVHDTIHAVGNFILAYVFGKNFIEVLERYNKRNKIEYLKF